MTPAGITPRQAEILGFIRSYSTARGYAPSYSEIGAAVGISSRGNIRRFISDLVERGHLVRIPNKKRSLAVVEERV